MEVLLSKDDLHLGAADFNASNAVVDNFNRCNTFRSLPGFISNAHQQLQRSGKPLTADDPNPMETKNPSRILSVDKISWTLFPTGLAGGYACPRTSSYVRIPVGYSLHKATSKFRFQERFLVSFSQIR
jgi:hypothetical protein